MVKLEEKKNLTEHKAIEAMPLPAKAYIPLSQHLGKICSADVKVGDSVFLGQKIGSVQVKVFSPIHASVSGKVIAIDDWPHPVLGRCKAVIIENDGLDKLPEGKTLSLNKEVEKMTPAQLRNMVFEAGVVGMGGASFPAHIKLESPKPLDTLIVNGAECEPYLTADSRLMIEKAENIISGIDLVIKCTQVKQVVIAIEDNKPEAIKVFRNAIRNTQYTIRILKSAYPQGGEKQLIKVILNKEVPSGKLPFDVGVLVHNVSTINAIYEAVYFSKPLYERVVTVTGDCLANPGNFLVRIGTPVKDLIARCGPLKKEPSKIIFGGPMMGIAQFDRDVPIIKSTNGVVILSEDQVKAAQDALCLRCSRCVGECPAGLMPCMIAMAARKEKWDIAKAYGCLDCIECGLCNYICPQKISILQLIKQAKARMPR